MADYYPLIARAIEGLSNRSPDARRSVYERARAALTDQLRSLDPPLSEAEIERERQSLDDAITRVEAAFEPPAPSWHVAEASPPPMPAAEPLPEPADLPTPEDRHSGYDDDALERHEPHFAEPAGPPRPRVDSRAPVVRSGNRGRAIALGAILTLVVGAIAVAAWFLRDRPANLPAQTPVAEAPAPRAPDGEKFNERVGGGAPVAVPPAAPTPAPAPAPAPAQAPSAPPRADVGVAQRAIFYEEDPSNPQIPKASPGRVVWRLETVNTGQGQPLETAVRAIVEIPDAGLTLNLLIRRNADQSLPASHTVELNFSTRSGEPGRAIRDVGLLQFKNEEASRGTPVAGLPVPVRENLFLIGLSNLRNDVDRNMELILRRNWIDLPIRTAAGQRAILSIEKGAAGEQVLNDAFRQWQ
jgi:hypothetical protein